MPLAPLDERDSAILAKSIERFDARKSPRSGDYVVFADGVTRRISDVTFTDSVQTSDGGSWYFKDGCCSFSGGLYPGIPRSSLTLTDEVRDGLVWFFHHDYSTAHNGVYAMAPFRVYRCNLPANR